MIAEGAVLADDPETGRAKEASRLRTVFGRGLSTVDAAIAVGLAVLGWYLISWWSQKVPYPQEVVSASVDILKDPFNYKDLWATFRRICIAFVLAFIIGSLMGGLIGIFRMAKAFFRPWVVVGMAAPMPVLVVVCVLVFGIGENSSLIALTISVAPFVATIVGDAVAGYDRQLVQMAEVFKVSRWEQVRHVLLPQVAPAMVAAARTGFALCWKLVVVIEALSSPDGVGSQMSRDFKMLAPERMIAWAILFTIIMKVVDVAVFQQVERRSVRWRRNARRATGPRNGAAATAVSAGRPVAA